MWGTEYGRWSDLTELNRWLTGSEGTREPADPDQKAYWTGPKSFAKMNQADGTGFKRKIPKKNSRKSQIYAWPDGSEGELSLGGVGGSQILRGVRKFLAKLCKNDQNWQILPIFSCLSLNNLFHALSPKFSHFPRLFTQASTARIILGLGLGVKSSLRPQPSRSFKYNRLLYVISHLIKLK